jgi:choline dehydrogenase
VANAEREFDYSVVSAGSAGCAVASRLAEKRKCTFLLVEVGGKDRNPWIHVPAGYYRTIRSPRLTRSFCAEPSDKLNRRQINWPRGRLLVGNGAINVLIYVRDHPNDFDHWKSLGNVGWGWKDVLPSFLNSENHEREASRYHGTSVPIRVSDIRDTRKICDAFIEAGKSLGLPESDDFNEGHQDGVSYYQLIMGRGRRSTPVAYLRQNRRPNLRSEPDKTVTMLRIENRHATDVTILHTIGKSETVRAWHEIVVFYGKIGSLHLLQVSGIAPGGVLRWAGIQVFQDLPGVGQKLTDRMQNRPVYRCARPIILNDVYGNLIRREILAVRYALFCLGPLSVRAGQAPVLRTDPALDRPDLELTFGTSGPGQIPQRFPKFTLLGYPLQSKSRALIEPVSPDISQAPKIVAGYLSYAQHQKMLVKALETCRNFAAQPTVESLIAEKHMPGPAVQSQADVIADIRDNATNVFHSIGTCRIVPKEETGTVGDSRLRLHGMKGLHVADASARPNIVSCNTNATTMMIGEKSHRDDQERLVRPVVLTKPQETDMRRLQDKRCIITGAASGIGRATAEAFVQEGARVVVADINREVGTATANSLGAAARYVHFDSLAPESIEALVRQAVDWLGGLDVLVQNAGVQYSGPVSEFDIKNWDTTYAINVRAYFLGTKFAVPHMHGTGGSIVNMASVAGKKGAPGMSCYASSKGAVIAMTAALGRELAPDNIRVNAVCPGWIDTDFNAASIRNLGGPEGQQTAIEGNVPMARQAVSAEVAPMFVYLASDEASYVTCQAFAIDGGMTQ